MFLGEKVNSWQQGPKVKANNRAEDGDAEEPKVLSCLLHTWSAAPVHHFAEAISTPVSELWHLIDIIGLCTEQTMDVTGVLVEHICIS